MKIFLTTALILSTICLFQTPHSVQAESNFHLTRGGGHGRAEPRRPAEDVARGHSGEDRSANEAAQAHMNDAPKAEDRLHTLENDARDWDGWGDYGEGYCDGPLDANGMCPSSSGGTTVGPSGGVSVSP